MPRLLIITGPLGSSNTVFSKLFALSEDVYGWKALLNNHTLPQHTEPFYELWQNPEALHYFDWGMGEYFVTTIPAPYMKNKVPCVPRFAEFIEAASNYAEVTVLMVGRDRNIIKSQNERVRGITTLHLNAKLYEGITDANVEMHFASYELVQLYGPLYLENLANQMDWPLDWYNPEVESILSPDTNAKYIKPVTDYWFQEK